MARKTPPRGTRPAILSSKATDAPQDPDHTRHTRHYHYGGELRLVWWPSAMQRYAYMDPEEAWWSYASLIPEGGWEIVEDVPIEVTVKHRPTTARERRERRKGWSQLSDSQRKRLTGAGRRRGMNRDQVRKAYGRGSSIIEELYGHRVRRMVREVTESIGRSMFSVWTAHEDQAGDKITTEGRRRVTGEEPESTYNDEVPPMERGPLLWVD